MHFLYKKHKLLIRDDVQKELHSYIIGTFSNLGSYVYEIYANPDHIHILFVLPRTITIADLIAKVKASSSKWLKQKGIARFSWQNGYGTFSVSASKVGVVREYIKNQKNHHKKITFKEEYLAFLKKYQVEYDERYLWD